MIKYALVKYHKVNEEIIELKKYNNQILYQIKLYINRDNKFFKPLSIFSNIWYPLHDNNGQLVDHIKIIETYDEEQFFKKYFCDLIE